jgi:16S rRNA (cytidine1402-2'-O)-methyltransferase
MGRASGELGAMLIGGLHCHNSCHSCCIMSEPVLPEDLPGAWQRVAERVDAQSWPTHALYVVATPIGNLGDLTLRGWQALNRADVIAAEDTRASRTLMDAWGISTPLIAVHRHNEASAAAAIVERLAAGQRVALVSDAGSPAVSDPGGRVVQAVHAAGLKVVPLPGPSAVIAALMATGVTTDAHPGFVFAGFAPTKSMARQRWIRTWTQLPAATVFYEAPHRIVASVQDLLEVLGPDRQVAFARELTKRFEELASMPLAQAPGWLTADAHREQGEYVVIVSAPEVVISAELDLEGGAAIDAWLDALLESVSVRDAARIAAKATGLPRDTIYARALSRKPSQ